MSGCSSATEHARLRRVLETHREYGAARPARQRPRSLGASVAARAEKVVLAGLRSPRRGGTAPACGTTGRSFRARSGGARRRGRSSTCVAMNASSRRGESRRHTLQQILGGLARLRQPRAQIRRALLRSTARRPRLLSPSAGLRCHAVVDGVKRSEAATMIGNPSTDRKTWRPPPGGPNFQTTRSGSTMRSAHGIALVELTSRRRLPAR